MEKVIHNIDLKKVSNNELKNIITKFEVGLPSNRIIAVVKNIINNKISFIL